MTKTTPGLAAHEAALSDLKQWGTAAQQARKAEAPAAKYTTPKPEAGLLVYECCFDGIFEPVICHLEYEPSQGDGYHLPRSEAHMTLGAAYLLGHDIYAALDEDMVSQIEYRAMLELGQQAQEDAAEARWEARSYE